MSCAQMKTAPEGAVLPVAVLPVSDFCFAALPQGRRARKARAEDRNRHGLRDLNDSTVGCDVVERRPILVCAPALRVGDRGRNRTVERAANGDGDIAV